MTWLAATVGALLVIAGAGLLWLRSRYLVVTVDGVSMEPAYRAGERVLVRRTTASRVAGGDVVLLRQLTVQPAELARLDVVPDQIGVAERLMLKRVAAVPGDPVPRSQVPALATVPEDRVPAGQLVVVGDNPELSYDSRQYGYLPYQRVEGVVVRRVGAAR